MSPVPALSWPRRAPALVLALLLAALSAPAAQVEPREVWITLAPQDAAKLTEALATQGRGEPWTIESEGKLVVARIHEDRLGDLGVLVHATLRHCGGFITHLTRAEAYQAVARAEAPTAIPAPSVPYSIDNGAVVQALIAPLQESNVRTTITTLGLFFTRYHRCQTGRDSAMWIRDLWQGYAAGRPDVTVELFNHTGYTTVQPSVILTIQGTTLPNEIVVLGAHQDSIAGTNCTTSRAPGEDDDASGIASLSETLRVALALGYHPQRTVKFMAYAAEEAGLLGSQQIAQQHQQSGANIYGAFQLDMTNYQGNPGNDIFIYQDFTNAVQNTFLEQLVDTYLQPLVRSTSQCNYGCSDHASWTNAGYPASFPFESAFASHNPFIHSSSDTIAQSGGNANHALKFSKLAAAYLAEAAKGTISGNQPPTVNAGPDQTVTAGTTVILSGSMSDPDGGPGPVTYTWTQVSGPAATIGNANQPVANVTPGLAATFVFRLSVSDGLLTGSDTITVNVLAGGGNQSASYDGIVSAPRCSSPGNVCDSGMLLNGRDGRGPEANQPNTLAASCADGTSGTYHVEESLDRIRVSTVDGTNLSPGKTVTVEATVWAANPANDRLDLYYAANAFSPSWTYLTTLTPSATGVQVLSATYVLPGGSVQAIRGRFRYGGSASPCGPGAYTDHDDLVFAVDAGTPAPSDVAAGFDATYQAPRCLSAGRSCDSGPNLLRGRNVLGPEPQQPNTVAGSSCADGASGRYHSDESSDRLKVSTVDGTTMAAGKTVRVEATVWAYREFTSDRLDLYFAPNAASPVWTLIATLTPTKAGQQTLSATYTLPSGANQAVRARFRYSGSAGACGIGAYDDHDDLVFAVP